METRQGEWKASGVPEGEYKVYFTKVVQIEEPEQPADMDSNEEAKAEYYKERQARLEAAANEIPKALTNYETSGITVTVSKSAGLNTTIDVAQYE